MTAFGKVGLRTVIIAGLGLPACASAAQFIGGWAPDADKYDKVFVRCGRVQEMQALVFCRQ